MLPLPWRECLTDSIFIGGSQDALQDEMAQNSWWLSLTDLELAATSADVLNRFIIDVIEDRRRQVRDHGQGDGILYLWHDKAAGQLRLNVISACHASLPFGCPVQLVESPARIVRSFLASSCREGILWSEVEEMPLSEAFGAGGEPVWAEDASPRVVEVYVARLDADH